MLPNPARISSTPTVSVSPALLSPAASANPQITDGFTPLVLLDQSPPAGRSRHLGAVHPPRLLACCSSHRSSQWVEAAQVHHMSVSRCWLPVLKPAGSSLLHGAAGFQLEEAGDDGGDEAVSELFDPARAHEAVALFAVRECRAGELEASRPLLWLFLRVQEGGMISRTDEDPGELLSFSILVEGSVFEAGKARRKG